MPKLTDRRDERVNQAADLARDVAPNLDIVLLTHYPDIETLDTLRPGETDLQLVQAVTRACATELQQAGVELLVQIAGRAAFRRWMSSRVDSPETRRAWIDRGRLLRGPAALELLGLQALAGPSRHSFGKAPGPAADSLLETFDDEDSDEFDVLVQALMTAGRTDILDLAVRKLGEQQGDEAGDELNWVLLVAAEGAALGPSGWAELVAIPVALPPGDAPDGEALGAGLLACGALADTDEVRFLPGWRSPEALAELSFAAVRRVLLDLIEGKEPRDLPPGDTDDLARRGFGVLVGLRTDWALPVWEEILAAGGLPELPEDDAEPTVEEADRTARLDRWRGQVFQQSQGCVPLGVVAFFQVANEVADFLADAGEEMGGLEDVRAFVMEGRRKAGSDEVACRVEIIGDNLELTLYTESGQSVDSLTMPASRLATDAEQIPRLIDAWLKQ